MDTERPRLANRVLVLSCVSFVLTACLQCGSYVTSAFAVNRVPSSYANFTTQCSDGHLPTEVCYETVTAFEDYCRTWEIRFEECKREFGEILPSLQVTVFAALSTTVMVCLVCSACVPFCGCFGAKKDVRGCMVIYVVMNSMQALLNAMSGVDSFMANVTSVIVPLASTYYGFKLQQRQAVPVLRQPAMAMPALMVDQFQQPPPSAPSAV
eukprot:TRINITY_DN35381_c0_g1_i1.p1 TRINITY_DN35381_c0_g1~~TRINITY_DN35381_c0_g1_i1.p1  ORF type:complete len:222 (+),score=15.21 TRINITY_DN35381_c0_g1_i1:38-667(+)